METLTGRELAKVFRVSPQTVRALAAKGKIVAIRVGGQWRYPVDRSLKLTQFITEEDAPLEKKEGLRT